jgi:hypothetical protein
VAKNGTTLSIKSKDTRHGGSTTPQKIVDDLASGTSNKVFQDLQSVNTDSATASRAARR